jgi:hypothetical protein
MPTERNDADAREAYVAAVVERGASQRLPDLFRARADAIYRLTDRNGVSVTVLPTPALDEAELIALLRYRLAQYIAVGFVDPDLVYEARMEHEPLSHVSADDIHLIAGSARGGELLCYLSLRAATPALPKATMGARARPLFPVEEAHGMGIFDRISGVAVLPARRVREFGRFIKNHRLHGFDELGLRAPVEVGVALVRSVAGPLRSMIDALIGDLEEGVADRNLDFFHIPLTVVRGTVGFEPQASYMEGRYRQRTVYPFAVLASDLVMHAVPRLELVEAALELPGRRGLAALLKLKRAAEPPRSRLEPPDGLPALTATPVPHEQLSTREREQLRRAGERLRETDAFAELTIGEATVLATLVERVEARPGEVLVREGESGDALFIIESGKAHVRLSRGPNSGRVLAELGRRDSFGEIALVMGIARTATVTAAEPLTALRLSRANYERFLATLPEVESELTVSAVRRLTRGA